MNTIEHQSVATFRLDELEILYLSHSQRNLEWLPRMDSNHDKVIQSHLCYRYTTRQISI